MAVNLPEIQSPVVDQTRAGRSNFSLEKIKRPGLFKMNFISLPCLPFGSTYTGIQRPEVGQITHFAPKILLFVSQITY